MTERSLAEVPHGAHVAIGTRCIVGREDAADIGVARIIGAAIAIVAFQGRTRLTRPLDANVITGARVTVVTGQHVVDVLTTSLWVTEVGGAPVVVITVQLTARGTPAVGATIAYGTQIAIITGMAVG